ncbi:protein S40-7-like [Gastrolobium bilobum]|uniref:protein S40-7-like n=1 Tax=Gastrolobium bilobum TaxID=150636 RepID=UPI002AB06122|nr:protein S40-7-like [Gastrolobium bilobum]
MADWGGFLKKSSNFGGGSMRNEDFDEEDVWGVAKEENYLRVSKDSSGSSSAWRMPTSPRKIQRVNSTTLPFSGSESDENVVQGYSAPMNIPDWSKIYGNNGKKGSRDGSCVAVGERVNNNGDCGYGDHYNDDAEDEDEGDMIPPHEWIARKLARSQISSFSVCEGIGRTLKGRDLSKVRNAVLTKTGFIE